MKEKEEIKRLFDNEDYDAVSFLLIDKKELQKEFVYEYAVSQIEISRDAEDVERLIESTAQTYINSGFENSVYSYAVDFLIQEHVENSELFERSVVLVNQSEKDGIPPTRRDELALRGFACLIFYYQRVKERFAKKGAIQLFFLHVFTSSQIFDMLCAEMYDKAADFLVLFKYTKDSFQKIMELVEMRCNSTSVVLYLALLRFYLYILQNKRSLFDDDALDFFRKEGFKCYEIVEKMKAEGTKSLQFQEMETDTQDKYINKLDKVVHDPEFSSTLAQVEHPVKTESEVLRQCKVLKEQHKLNAVLDLIENSYPKNGSVEAPSGIIKFYERVITELFESTDDSTFVLRGLKYNSNSQVLRNLLL